MAMDIVKDWEALISDLKRRIQTGDESCRPLLHKAEAALKEVREKQTSPERNRDGR
jgi:hypothetical protein